MRFEIHSLVASQSDFYIMNWFILALSTSYPQHTSSLLSSASTQPSSPTFRPHLSLLAVAQLAAWTPRTASHVGYNVSFTTISRLLTVETVFLLANPYYSNAMTVNNTYISGDHIRGLHWYKCKDCDRNYMVEHKPEDVKRQALLMYLENSGFNPIGRILRVSSDTMDLDLR